MSNQGWIGIDLDGTLARYDGWKGATEVGEPVPAMLELVKNFIKQGVRVKIFTARVYCGESGEPEGDRYREAQTARLAIEKWCAKHVGVILPVTCCKDFGMITLYDDRCIQVVPNTGETLTESVLRSLAKK